MVTLKNLPSKAILMTWTKKIIYGLLLFWVCGVGPLIYFESLSSHQGVSAYHLTIFEKPNRPDGLLALSEIFAQQQGQSFSRYKWLRSNLIKPNLSLTSTIGVLIFGLQIWLLPLAIFNLSILVFRGRVLSDPLIGHSAWLSPPEKPPRLLSYSLT